MEKLSTGRAAFVQSLITHWQDQGLSHQEICKVAAATADILEQVQRDGVSPAEFVEEYSKEGHEKVASGTAVGALGTAINWAAIGDVLKSVAGGGFGLAKDMTGKVVDTGLKSALPLAAAGLAIPAGIGYAAGKGMGEVSDDPDDRVEHIKHQEMLETYRRNAANLRRLAELENHH